MSSSAWELLRDELVEGFGAHPWERDADVVERAFARHPGPTRASAGKVLERVRAGKVRDGWRVLAIECGGERAASRARAEESSPAVVAERRLRSWVRNEGRHYEPAVFGQELARRLDGAGLAGDQAARARLERQHAALRVVDAGHGATA